MVVVALLQAHGSFAEQVDGGYEFHVTVLLCYRANTLR
jgi:hypothetical protein